MRLNAFLARAGICSRRQADELIASGQIRVNGQVMKKLGTAIDPEQDQVVYRGEPVTLEAARVTIMLHKPVDVVSSCTSQRGEKTVVDFVDVPERLYPVGRLDKDSSGLLLLTNDGKLALELTHPRYEHEKEYLVKTRDFLSDTQVAQLRRGIFLDGAVRKPYQLKQLTRHTFSIVLREGRKRQVRRMLEGVGNRVVALQRVRVGNLKLGTLQPGKWRLLSEDELKLLKK